MTLRILGAYGGLTVKSVDDHVLVGELSLDGSIRPVRRVLPIAVATRANKVKNLLMPESNANEAAVVTGITVCPVKLLTDVVHFYREWHSAGKGG